MVDTGIVQKLLELLDRHVEEGNVTVQHAALSALRNLAIPGEPLHQSNWGEFAHTSGSLSSRALQRFTGFLDSTTVTPLSIMQLSVYFGHIFVYLFLSIFEIYILKTSHTNKVTSAICNYCCIFFPCKINMKHSENHIIQVRLESEVAMSTTGFWAMNPLFVLFDKPLLTCFPIQS